MIKVTLENYIKPLREKPFPKLMISITTDPMIVLFISHGDGIVLKEGNTKWKFGQNLKCFVMDDWKDYEGPITLENV